MPQYLLAKHVHFCEIGNQVIFLDLRRDKYLAVAGSDRQTLKRYVRGWPMVTADDPGGRSPASSPEELVQTMVKLGVLTNDAALGREATAISLESVAAPLAEEEQELQHPVTALDFTALVLACIRAYALLAAVRLHVFRLERVTALVRQRKQRQQAHASVARCRNRVAVFKKLRPLFYTSKDACLFDSLVLVEFLAMYKCFPTWVFGVRVAPFAAHSWVQGHGCVFNGSVEYVRAFTPIVGI